MSIAASVLALLVGVAGWYYLFYSQAAQRLETVEAVGPHRWRLLLRRINSIFLLLLAAGFYAGFTGVDEHRHPQIFVLVWAAVLLLVVLSVLLALIDLRLTARLRKKTQT